MVHSFLNSLDDKNSVLKKKILGLCVNDGDYSIADLNKELNASIPTITKLVGELINEGFLVDMGKLGTSGGRRPSIYGLNPSAGYITGIDAGRDYIDIAVTDFKGKMIAHKFDIPFTLENNDTSFKALCSLIQEYMGENGINISEILAYGVNLTGRVNHVTGYSYSYFAGEEKPISDILANYLDTPVFIENDSRAMCYGEYICGIAKNTRNMLYINVSWGLGMGMILDGKLYYGKSGFSGEIGHFPLLDNEVMCRCGKIGCLETEASGSALYRDFIEKIKEGRPSVLTKQFNSGMKITLESILSALHEEDMLAIESMEQIGHTIGRAIAGLINIFNPEMIVIGGKLAIAKDYMLLPIKTAINKHSLNIVSKDTSIVFSKLGQMAGPIGACMLARSRLLGLLD